MSYAIISNVRSLPEDATSYSCTGSIDQRYLLQLKEALNVRKLLSCIIFQSVCLGNRGVEKILPLEHATTLILTDAGITLDKTYNIVTALLKCTALKVINFSKNYITPDGVGQIQSLVSNHPTLHTLILQETNLSPQSVLDICLSASRRIVQIDITKNKSLPPLAQQAVDAFLINRKVRRLRSSLFSSAVRITSSWGPLGKRNRAEPIFGSDDPKSPAPRQKTQRSVCNAMPSSHSRRNPYGPPAISLRSPMPEKGGLARRLLPKLALPRSLRKK